MENEKYIESNTHTPRWLSGKRSACQFRRCRRCEFDPWVGKIPWRRNSNPLQYSCLENPMHIGAWQASVHRAAKSQTQLKPLSMCPKNGASQVVLVVKNLLGNARDMRDLSSIPGSARFHGEGHGNTLQFSCLEYPMDRGVWRATVHRVI